jgi:hypothetical protein
MAQTKVSPTKINQRSAIDIWLQSGWQCACYTFRVHGHFPFIRDRRNPL